MVIVNGHWGLSHSGFVLYFLDFSGHSTSVVILFVWNWFIFRLVRPGPGTKLFKTKYIYYLSRLEHVQNLDHLPSLDNLSRIKKCVSLIG